MTNSYEDIGQWMQDLAARSMSDQLRAAQRYNELLQRFGRGELFAPSVSAAYWRFVREEALGYARSLANLSLSYYSALDALGRAYNDRFYDQVLGAGPTDRAQPPAPATAQPAARPRQVELALHAPAGEEASRAFVLENKRAETAEISFLVSDFVDPAGAEPFRPPLQFDPPRFSMAPGAERTVTLRLRLLPDLFVPGQRYTAAVLVRGYDDLELALHVWADAPSDAAAQAGGASESATGDPAQ
ncbi:MAG TPA: hypothetical protein VF897_11160 [Roseiflexaceae bacterium]